MRQIKELAEHIEEEIHDAHKYIEAALMYKGSDKELAEMYSHLSDDELIHSHREHEQVVRLIRKLKDTPPPEMMAVWEYLHKKHIECESEVKRLQAMYRE